jgi:hypothetical protein
MAAKVAPLQETQVAGLSEFLRRGLWTPGTSDEFARPEVLRWKYFGERGSSNIPRSFVVSDGERIEAHAGLIPTAFGLPGFAETEALHIVDWLTSQEGAALGAVLMMRAFTLAPVAYALGCTPAAARVLLRAGYEIVADVPLYHRVIRRTKGGVWKQLHGGAAGAGGLALLGIDLAQSLRRLPEGQVLRLRTVEKFGQEVLEMLSQSKVEVTCSSRVAKVLNHYLAFPGQVFHGFLFESNGLQGFGILNVIDRPGVRLARIVECFLNSTDPSLWRDATGLLTSEAIKRGADLVSAYGSTNWMAEGLRKAGFFRRGKTPFYLRDPKKLISRSRPFHLTHLEADLSYI